MRAEQDTTTTQADAKQTRSDPLSLCRNVTELSPLAMIAVEGQTHIVRYANPAFCRLAGKAREELIGRSFAEAVPEGEENGCQALLERVYSTGETETLAHQEHTSHFSLGVRWSYVAWAVLDEEERPTGVMIQITDTSAAAQILRQYEQGTEEIKQVNEQLLISGIREHELAALTVAQQQQLLQTQMLSVAREQEAAILAERNRIAADLHDTLAQGFTGIKLQLDNADDLLASSPEEAHIYLLRARAFAQQCIVEARRTIHALRAQALESGDLPSALARLVAQTTSNTLQIRLDVQGTPCALSPAVESSLFRIGQETITNALRHSKASEITLTLTYAPGWVQLQACDNGQGFDPHLVTGGLGLYGMRERAARLGGEATIQSQSGQGTRIDVRVPIPPSPLPETPASPQ